jgi:large repetitive protein
MIILGAGTGGMQPSAPTIGTATGGDTTASVAFTASSYIGKGTITYTATSSPGGLTATGASSPLTVSGLTNGTAYTFTVVGNTNYGVASVASAASNSVTPAVSGPPVAGYSVWLDAADASTVTIGSSPGASAWTDKSANAFVWSQGTAAKQPQYNTRTQNGKALFDFDGGFGDKRAFTANAANSNFKFTTDGDSSFFIAMLSDQSPAPGVMMTNNAFGSPGNGFFNGYATSGRLTWDLYFGSAGQQAVGNGFSQPTSSVSTFLIGSILTDPANGTAANRSFIRWNMGTVYNQNTSTGGPSASDPSSNLTIGGSAGAPSNGDYFDGTIGEIIMYNYKLSDANRDATVSYLMSKWGVV